MIASAHDLFKPTRRHAHPVARVAMDATGDMPVRVIVVGAGVGGLAAAIDLAARGCAVTVLERGAAAGGKMRQVVVGGLPVDAGPTVLTMRRVFEALFADAGASLPDAVTTVPASVLARHAWEKGGELDLFADPGASADAIGRFAGAAEARGFEAFRREARLIYETLEAPFLLSPRPSRVALARRAGLRPMLRIRPFETMMRALGRHFRDPRLRQLFGRYATYCGSSPWRAPATLMLVAHVEQMGVWYVEGGMIRLAEAMAALLTRLGGTLRLGADVEQVIEARGRAAGVRLRSGERVEADAVILNGAPSAFGAAGSAVGERSLSAVTWAIAGRAEGFPLIRHNVFFSADYGAEFRDLFEHGRAPARPTVYVCAQDRVEGPAPAGRGPERFLCLINAPARSGAGVDEGACEAAMRGVLARCGLTIEGPAVATGPARFATLFPGTAGALYGRAVHGSTATFRRPGTRARLPGLYYAGGHCHPGAGVPMAALSGRLAASALMADRASILRSRMTATRGGTSTR